MTPFLLIAGAVLAVVLLLLILPLFRQSPEALPSDDTREQDIRIARERLEELKKEKARGELSDEEFEQAKADLEIALAQDLEVAETHSVSARRDRASLATVITLVVLVPTLVAAVYLQTGSPDLLDPAAQRAAATPNAPGTAHKPGSIAELVKQLEQHMEQDPNNPKGWFLLGRTYMQLDRYDDAVKAFTRLEQLLPDNPTVMISLADALSMQNGGQVPEKAVALLDKVLAIEPDNATALWLRGNAAGQRKQDAEALKYWSRAWPLLAEAPQLQRELENLIHAVEQRSGLKAELKPNAPAASPAMAADGGATTSAPPAAGGPSLQVEVALDPELMSKVSPDDLVFIYAKAASGPPMPLAVARKRVADLPVKVTLNDGMAMMPQMRLSSFPKVKVGARISKSGRPIAQPGDLQATEVETANDRKEPIQLLIDSVR